MNCLWNVMRALRASFGALAFVAAFVAAPAVRGAGLEKQMLHEAPKILAQLKKKGYKNVGILKFRVKKGNEPVTDNAGPLNLTLANRLETALLLANKVREPLGIIHDASTLATRISGASHLNAEGRKKLFGGNYPLAWGKDKVKPDAFLTGVALISPDLRDMTVGILAFDKNGDKMHKVAQFIAPVDVVALVESGESFLLRGAFDHGAAVLAATRVRKKDQDYPLADEAAPVELEVRYDGAKVPVEIKDGVARLREPEEGQTVTFILRRRLDNKERYAVVLKVNGENTLYKQRMRDIDCRKWVLDPGDKPMYIEGFQKDGKTAEKFRVMSRQESKASELYYGADVGTVSITVFREKKGKDKPMPILTPEEADEAEDLEALTRSIFPPEQPRNLAALQVQMREQATRGLIAEGEKTSSGVQRVKFNTDPIPVMSVTITYYKP